MTVTCPICEHTPCLAEQSAVPDGHRCVLGHRRDTCRPRRAAPGLLVCIGHRDGLLRTLRHLAALDRLLAARATAGGGPRSGARSAETRIPVDERAAKMRRDIRRKLAGWVAIVAADRQVMLPWQSLAYAVAQERDQLAEHRRVLLDMPDPPPKVGRLTAEEVEARVAYEHLAEHHAALLRESSRVLARLGDRIGRLEQATDTGEIVAWLVRHHDHLLADPAAADGYATDLTELSSAAWPIAYPAGSSRVPIGPCPQVVACSVVTRGEQSCTGTVSGHIRRGDDLLPSELVCDTCGSATPPHSWITLGRRLAEAADHRAGHPIRPRPTRWLSASDLAELWEVPLKTVHRWSRWHRWPNDGARPARYNAEKAQDTYDHYRGAGEAPEPRRDTA